MIAYYFQITFIIGVTIMQCLLELFYGFCSIICVVGNYPYNVVFLIFIYLFSIVFFGSFVMHIVLLVRYLQGKSYNNVEKKTLLIVFIVETVLLGVVIVYDIVIYGIRHNDDDYKIVAMIYFVYQLIFNYSHAFLHCLYSAILLRQMRDYSAMSLFGCFAKEKDGNKDKETEKSKENEKGDLNKNEIQKLNE